MFQYEVQVEWDKEAKVWYIEDSNVPGLVGEAPTLEVMMTLLQVRIPEMLEENNSPRNEFIPLRLLTVAVFQSIQKFYPAILQMLFLNKLVCQSHSNSLIRF